MREYFIDVQFKIIGQRHVYYLHVVDVSRHFIHPISGWTEDDAVFCRLAEDAVYQVDYLIAAVPDKDVFNRDMLEIRQCLL